MCQWVSDDSLLSGGSSGRVVLWQLASLRLCKDGIARGDEKNREVARTIHWEHKMDVCCVRKAGEFVVSVGKDRAVMVADAERFLYFVPAFPGSVLCVEPAPAGGAVAIGSDAIINVWNTGESTSTLTHA